MKSGVAVFRAPGERYYADTCEPLKQGVEAGEVKLVARARGAYPGLPLPDEAVAEVRTVGYWDADHDQSWGLDWHRNEGIEITYVARGKVGFSVDGQGFQLKSGDLTVTRPWQQHRVGRPHVEASRLYWLILDVGVRRPNQPWRWPHWLVLSGDDLASLTTNLSHNEQPVWPADDEIAQFFERLGETVESFDQPTGESRLKLNINGMLIALTEMLRREQPALDPSLSSSQRTVELFLASLPDQLDHPWSVDSMATACGLGRSRFTQYCEQLTNVSPNEYLTRCRVEAAMRLLRSGSFLSITDVAFRTGFSSSQYFATVFRRFAGCTPTDYRHDGLASFSQHG
jgi:AraC family L-rhamnose operon regulatory protein RhaS